MHPAAAAVRFVAEEEVRQERFRAAVEAEKARLRTHLPLIQRLAAYLPFTITRKPKP
jgi:hypothetical protein